MIKTVHPKVKMGFGPYVEQPATVEAYYSIDVHSDVTGKILTVGKVAGQAIAKDEIFALVRPSGSAAKSGDTPIVAPISGIVSSRGVDPGSFVVSPGQVTVATTIATIIRNDIVTLIVRIPDTAALMITPETPAFFRPEGQSGAPFKLRISRITPSLTAGDRSIGIEFDVYNKSEAEYLILMSQAHPADDFKGGVAPQFPDELRGTQRAVGLLPGTFGQMRFNLVAPSGNLAIPASCIVMEGGVPYVLTRESGLIRKKKVEINFDDGAYVSVSWSGTDPTSGMRIASDLSLDDEIVLSNQSEVEEGQNVVSVLTEW